jgi:hypothetical protein
MLSTFFCWVCDLVGAIISFLPSTPSQYTIGGLIEATGKALPMIGTGLLSEIYTMVQGILALFLVIKAFKIFQYFKVW